MSIPEKSMEQYDHYINQLFAVEDDVLQATRAAMQQAGLPSINVSASGGQLLHLLALMSGAKRILEIGTLGGYSAIWLARALPADGKLISLEIDEHHANVARRNVAQAGLAEKVEVRVGPALATLTAMEQTGEAPFDLIFIDADKDGYVAYLPKAVALVREGGSVEELVSIADRRVYLAKAMGRDRVVDRTSARRAAAAGREHASLPLHSAMV